MKIENNLIVYEVPSNDRIYTSSPENFGNLSWHIIFIQYVNDNGVKTSELIDVSGSYGGSISSRTGSNIQNKNAKRTVIFDSSKANCL